MSDTDTDESELIFKRFPAEKQDQVRALVNYATLMGLDGKDLVSIGGKLERLKLAIQRKADLEIAQGFECLPFGNYDPSLRDHQDRLDVKFKLETVGGTYKFTMKSPSWSDAYTVQSVTTGKTKTWSPTHTYELGRLRWKRRIRYWVLLDISHGHFLLNF